MTGHPAQPAGDRSAPGQTADGPDCPPDAGPDWPDAGPDWPPDAWDSQPDEGAAGWRDNAAMQGQTGAQQTREQQAREQQARAQQTGDQRSNAQRSADQRDHPDDRSGPGQKWASQASAPHEQADWQAGDQADQPRLMDGPLHAGDERWAMLSYLGVPFLGFLVPLAIYLAKWHSSRYVRRQAAQALNLAFTGLLYTFSLLILAGILALDSLNVALVITVPLAAALWVATLVYVIRAAATASRGEYYQIPGWICATMVR